MRPHVVDEIRSRDGKLVSSTRPTRIDRAISAQTAQELTQIMESVVTGGTGTAAQIPGIRVAGKTGTAEIGVQGRYVAWFIAFAPADHPKYAIAVLVEHGGSDAAETTGGRVAAPIAKQVLQTLLTTPTPASRCAGQPASP
jgi:peptidoglycan glycosyltransferase